LGRDLQTPLASADPRRRTPGKDSQVKLRKSIVVAAGGFSLLAVALSGPASADTNVGNTTTLAAVGSDTSQDVMEGLSSVIGGATPVISNYKAIPVGRTITTRTGNANCTFTAPANSGGGRDALSAAMRAAAFGGSLNLAGCVDIARSSSGSNPTVSPGLGSMTYIPFATDSVTFATLGTTNLGHKLAKADLVAIYSANTGACIGKPLLPTLGSGTRTFFVQSLGLADVAIGAAGGPGTCVKDVTAAGAAIQEHDGRFLTDPANLIPFSTAQYIGQSTDAIANQLGRATLGAIDFSAVPDANLTGATSPTLLKTSFGFSRPIYNVVPTTQTTGGTTTQTALVGPTSQVCSAQSTIELFGFALNSTCGDITKKNTN
jgi:hypothetical protein